MTTQHDIPDLIAGALGVSRGTAYDLMREALVEQSDKDGSPCPEFWDWLPKAYNFEGDGNFTKYNMEVAFLAGRQSVQQQEPVAYGMWDTMLGKGHRMMMVRLDKGQDGCTVPLYTSPPPRKPLTDEQIKLVMDGRGEEGDDDYVKPAFDPFGISEDDLINFARAIEAAHGIKGKA